MEPTETPAEKIAAPWWALYALGAATLVIFTGALVEACFIENETLRTAMFGAAIGGYSTTLGFFLGSSAGSQAKDKVIASLPPTPH